VVGLARAAAAGAANRWMVDNRTRRPRYFIFNQSDLKKYIKQKKALVGYAKSAFVDWLLHFGGSAPSWIKRFSKGNVTDKTDSGIYPRAEMRADISYLASLDNRNKIVSRAMAQTEKALVTRARYEVKKAARRMPGLRRIRLLPFVSALISSIHARFKSAHR